MGIMAVSHDKVGTAGQFEPVTAGKGLERVDFGLQIRGLVVVAVSLFTCIFFEVFSIFHF